MLNKQKLNIAIIAVALSVVCCAGGNAQTNGRKTECDYAPVTLPEIPENITFAGEKVPMNEFYVKEAMQRELITNEYMHTRMLTTLLNTNRYFSVIEPILKKYGIPEDFKYLCVAESNLNPDAVSSAGAAGLWQFMASTAKEYGLLVNSCIDERYDPEKATDAACRYLLNAHGKLGNWTLVAASYNVGINGVLRRLNQQFTDSYYDTVMPIETSRYVFRILAYKVMMADPEAYGYCVREKDKYPPLDKYRKIKVGEKNIDWVKVARDNGITYKLLKLYNPWIRTLTYENKDGREFEVKIPVAKTK